jgi:hypothetical protein
MKEDSLYLCYYGRRGILTFIWFAIGFLHSTKRWVKNYFIFVEKIAMGSRVSLLKKFDIISLSQCAAHKYFFE